MSAVTKAASARRGASLEPAAAAAVAAALARHPRHRGGVARAPARAVFAHAAAIRRAGGAGAPGGRHHHDRAVAHADRLQRQCHRHRRPAGGGPDGGATGVAQRPALVPGAPDAKRTERNSPASRARTSNGSTRCWRNSTPPKRRPSSSTSTASPAASATEEHGREHAGFQAEAFQLAHGGRRRGHHAQPARAQEPGDLRLLCRAGRDLPQARRCRRREGGGVRLQRRQFLLRRRRARNHRPAARSAT